MKKSTYFFLLFALFQGSLQAKLWKVGPGENYKFCSAVVSLVNDGDTINIAAADYVNDAQVQWTKNNLLIRGVGGRPRLFAGALIANDQVNGKGIFVVKGNYCTIENIDFRNAKCLSNNGAGIRQEGSNVLVRNCRFENNEMGILGGGLTTLPNSTYIIEFCEFYNGGSVANPGYQHNIYINHIDTFIFRYNWSHDAIAEGHELKSRANNTYILYNRISNIATTDSRNIDIPNGGTAIVMGNILEQGMNSANSNIMAYGLEGLSNPGPHNVFVCYNTFVNKKDKGSFIQVPASGCDTLLVKNNILSGAKTGGLILGTPATLDSSHNYITDFTSDVKFINSNNSDYRLTANSPAVDKGKFFHKLVKGHMLYATKTYSDTCSNNDRVYYGYPDIGAFECENPASTKKYLPSSEPYRYSVSTKKLMIHNLKNKDILEARLFNSEGRNISVPRNNYFDSNSNFMWDLSNYSPGFYTITISTKTGEGVIKIYLE